MHKYILKYYDEDGSTHYGPTYYDNFFIARDVAKQMQRDFPHAVIEIVQKQGAILKPVKERLRLV